MIGALLSIAGLSLLVFGVLNSGTWGLVRAKPGGPHVLETSPVVWLVIGGLLVIYCFFLWEAHVERRGHEPLVRPRMLRNTQLAGGLSMFFFQFFIQAGVFFTIPLFFRWCSNCRHCRPVYGFFRFRSPCWSPRWASPSSLPPPGPA